MIFRPAFLFCFLTVFAFGCSKEGKLSNFSNIYVTDYNGTPLGGDLTDGQWQNRPFTESEMDLFTDLDTANTVGTLKPFSASVRYAFPNPFSDLLGVPISLDDNFTGDIVVKYVVVNRSMKVVQKGAQRLQATSRAQISLIPAFPAGKYRLYFTLNSNGNEHFYKSWGNIERK